jgi:hypothetical protein
MAGACGREDAIKAGGDVNPGKVLEQLLAQHGQTQRGAVVEQARRVGAGDFTNGITDVIAFMPGIRQPAAAEFKLAHGVIGKRPPIALRALIPVALVRDRRLGHHKPRALPRCQQPLSDHPLEGLDDAGLAKQVIQGHLPDGRQARAGTHPVLADPLRHRADDLLHHRYKGLSIDP